MASDDLDEVRGQLLETIADAPQFEPDSEQSHFDLKQAVEQSLSGGPGSLLPVDISIHLARYLWLVFQHDPTWTEVLTRRFADACRDHAILRDLYGLRRRLTPQEYRKGQKKDTEPDCVLEVARRMVVESKRERDKNLKDSLRIIANCCADNNDNRALIIYRDTFGTLTRNAAAGIETTLTIVTLYNICTDFDEPAEGVSRQTFLPPNSISSTDIHFTAADQALSTCFESYSIYTRTEILVDAGNYCDDLVLPNLCDLIEMSTRLAIYDAESFLPPTQLEAKTYRYHQLVDTLVLNGSRFATQSSECRQSMCQAVLNLLSSSEVQQHFLTMSTTTTLEAITQLPYQSSRDKDVGDLSFYQTTFLKWLYEMSSKPQFSMTYHIPSHLQVYCVKNITSYDKHIAKTHRPGDYHSHPTFAAGMFVLLSNMTTTRERAELLANHSDVAIPLVGIIERDQNECVLIPTLNLAIRITLSAAGRDLLLLLLKYPVLSTRLRDTKSPTVLREIIVLERYLLKSSSDRVIAVLSQWTASTNHQQDPSSLDVILSLFATTIDESIKFEIGRLTVEVLRTTFASKNQNVGQSEAVIDSFSFLSEKHKSETFMNPLEFLVRKGSSTPQYQAEGWFALAILSTSHLGRQLVSKMLSTPEMLEVLDEVVKLPDGPVLANVKLMLAKLQSEPDVVPELVRYDLSRMMVDLGISLPVDTIES